MKNARRAFAFAGLLSACAGARVGPPAAAPIVEPATAPPPPRDEAAAPARAGLLACRTIRLDVSLTKLRSSRRAAWLAAIFRAEPRLAALAIPGKVEPLVSADEARLCGLEERAWEAVVVRHTIPEALVHEALAVYAARVDRGGPVGLGLPGVAATKIRLATDVWTAIARGPGELWLVAPEAARAAVVEHEALAHEGPALAPADAARAWVNDPAAHFAWAAHELREARALEAWAAPRADGGAEVGAIVTTANEADARAVARKMTETVERAAGTFFVRVALRGILSGFSAKALGTSVHVALPVSAPELDSLLALVAAHLGAKLPEPPPPPRSPHDASGRGRSGGGLSSAAPSVVKDAP